jgi:Ca2+-binding RTX toxin-like protein
MPTAVAPTGNPSIDGILWGWKWDTTQLTVSFPTFNNVYGGYSNIVNFQSFTQFQANQIINFGLNNLGVFTNLSFSNAPQGNGHLRFAQAERIDYGPQHFNSGLHIPGGRGSAEANPPDPNLVPAYAQGDNWFTLGQYQNPVLGSFQYAAGLLHEVGHSLGLKHGHATQGWSNNNQVTFPVLPADQDSQEFSVMTYRSYPGVNLSNGASGQEEYPWTYMINDYAALQHMYGANFGQGSNETDTTYQFNPNTGEMSINNFGFGASYNAKILLSIWDGGGTDLFDFTNYSNDQTIDLRPGEFSTFSKAQLANLSNGHAGDPNFARGNIANPYLYQDDLRSLIENVDTGSGNDRITGNQVDNRIRSGDGNDVLSGGAGDDTLEGGLGADWITPGSGADSVDGGDGSDMVSFADLAQFVRVELDAGTAVTGGETNTLTGVENVTGSIFGDVLQGDASGNRLRGLGDYDWFLGSGGNDSYDGGSGRDMMSYVYSPDAVTLNLETGSGTAGQAAGDTYTSIERVTGSVHGDLIYGGTAEEDFRGIGGYDWFIGSTGGKDRYDGGSGLDTVAYWNAAAGVTASLLLGRGSAGEAVRDLFTSIENLGGSNHDDHLTGDNGRNYLRGYSGDDLLEGAGGVDRLFGGRGNDTLDGGNGWDYALFSGNRAEYTISTVGSRTTVTHSGGDGTDTVLNVEGLQFADDLLYL